MELIQDPEILEGYLCDASNTRGTAEALVRPKTTEEVAEVVRHCQKNAIPLTVTAQRTSTTGASVPDGGWLLSTEHLNKVLAQDEVEAGVILGQYQNELAKAGKLFPPDPTSRHECSVGAAIACNASGARSFRYGPTRPWVKRSRWCSPLARWSKQTVPPPFQATGQARSGHHRQSKPPLAIIRPTICLI